MAILQFRADEVRPIIDHALAAKEWDMGYESEMDPRPAIFIVGDHGVYMMSNGKPHLQRPDKPEGSSIVCYAVGINPDKDADWWETKRAVFGGDDGADTLPWAEAISEQLKDNPKFIRIRMTRNDVELLAPEK